MTFLAQEVIRRKRDGAALSAEEIEWLVTGITDGSVSDAQVGALAMAIVIKGMSADERVALTGAMTRSGEVLTWDLDRPVVDKHSTGGVGDKVSLLLAPIIAACGGAVPMISGRGLGHTGGTLDKLDAIPGYDTAPGRERFVATVREAGCAIIGQTGDLAPADKRLYAIRDATGTVESIPLIVASILSKKLAAGLDALVMDVKVGSGAFLPELDQARELAQTIIEVAAGNGLPTAALLTDMDRVLGRTAGNAVEVRESIDHLTGAASDPRLLEVTFGLCEQLLRLKGLDGDPRAALESGAAAEAFARMVAALGGPADLLERPDDHLPAAPVTRSRRRPTAPASSPASTCAPSASPSSTSAAVGAARTTPSTTPSASPRSRPPASASGPRAARWPSSTPVTRLRPPVPPRRSRPPFASATACWTRTRRCSRSWRALVGHEQHHRGG